MSRDVNLSDVLHHVETDLKEVLDILKKEYVFEVMLNPYERFDGQYEGHLWYEEAGIGMKRLSVISKHDFLSKIKPDNNSYILYKKFKDKILSYQPLERNTNKNDLLNIISLLLIFTLEVDEEKKYYYNHEENYKLNEFALNIKNGRLNLKDKLNINENVEKIITDINAELKKNEFQFTIGYCKYDTGMIINPPEYYINRKFIKLEATKAEQIINTLASANNLLASERSPIVECQIPYYKHRFTGVLKPVVKFPSFTIRKHSSKSMTLDDYVLKGIISDKYAVLIREWIKRRWNILIAGGVGSGKTTLLNALLKETDRLCPEHRAVIIEDTPEIQCSIDNSVALCQTEDVSIPTLLKTTLRLRPDRIILGELRGKEAYTLLKAWMTGHPGGFATIHANGANEAVYRFEQCIRENDEARSGMLKEQIGLAIQGIISIQKVTTYIEKNGIREATIKRTITAIREIRGWKSDKEIYADTWHYKDPEAFGEFVSDSDEEIDTTFL